MHHVRTAMLLLALLLFSEASFADDPHANAAADAAAAVSCAAGSAVLLAGVPDSAMPPPENEPLLPAPDDYLSARQIASNLGPRRLSNGDTLNYVPLPTDWDAGWPWFGDSSALVYTPQSLLRMQLGNQDPGKSWGDSSKSSSGVYDLVLRYPSGYYWCYTY